MQHDNITWNAGKFDFLNEKRANELDGSSTFMKGAIRMLWSVS